MEYGHFNYCMTMVLCNKNTTIMSIIERLLVKVLLQDQLENKMEIIIQMPTNV
jgi:hypothetical protein